MINGTYRYADKSSPYDRGILIVDVKDTDSTLTLTLKEMDLFYSTYIDVLFRDKTEVKINKNRSPHALTGGADWFVIYPNRNGVPLVFDLVGGDE